MDITATYKTYPWKFKILRFISDDELKAFMDIHALHIDVITLQYLWPNPSQFHQWILACWLKSEDE